jgi:hypothetical protein
MVRASADHSYAYPVALIPAGESIDDVDAVPGVEVVDGTFTVDAPDLVGTLARGTHAHVMVFRMGRWRWMRGSQAPAAPCARVCTVTSSFGYAPSVHDVCHQSSQANAANQCKSLRDERNAEKTYVGIHRLVDRTPPDLVL